jgi:hypothetical protein
MNALLPSLSKAWQVPPLQRLCLRAVVRHVDALQLARLPGPLLNAVFLECQERFALEEAAALRRFFALPLGAWRAREHFLDASLFDEAVTAWAGSLRTLELWQVEVSPEALAVLGERLPHLVDIALLNTPQVDDECLARLFGPPLCARVERICLSRLSAAVSDKGFVHLRSSCPRLVSFSVDKCAGLLLATVAGVSAQAGPRLLELRANDCEADDKLARVLAQHCPNLQLLELHNGSVTDRGMVPLLAACGSLRHLRLSLTGISCDSLASLSASTGGEEGDLALTHLDLSLLYNVTKEAVQELLYRCGNLEELSLKDNDEIDDETVDVFCTCCPRLRRLNLAKCALVTDAGISQIVAELEQLSDLNLRKCPQITPRMRMVLAQMHVRVEM